MEEGQNSMTIDAQDRYVRKIMTLKRRREIIEQFSPGMGGCQDYYSNVEWIDVLNRMYVTLMRYTRSGEIVLVYAEKGKAYRVEVCEPSPSWATITESTIKRPKDAIKLANKLAGAYGGWAVNG